MTRANVAGLLLVAWMWFPSASWAESLEELTQRATQGDVKAQTTLGTKYAEGINTPVDYHQALKWFKSAAEHGNAVAEYNLGLMYILSLIHI